MHPAAYYGILIHVKTEAIFSKFGLELKHKEQLGQEGKQRNLKKLIPKAYT